MSWSSVPLKALFRRRKEVGRPDLPLLSVYRDLGIVPREGREDNFNRPSEDLSNYSVVHVGDLVLNKMKTWQGSLGISRHVGIVSPAYYVCERVGDVDTRFVHHLLRSRPLIAEYAARSKGIRPAQWDLPWDAFRDIRINLPGIAEQVRIADFLDTETTRIDKLIEKKRGIVEALRERWAADRRHAVVRGLDTIVKLRGTGVPWLEHVPANWRPSKLQHLGLIRGGMTPSTERRDYWEGDIPWVSPKDMKQFDLAATTDHVTSRALAETGLSLVEPDSVLFVVRGMILAQTFPVAVNAVAVTVNQDMKALRPDLEDPRYLAHMLAGISDSVLALLVEESAHGTRVLRIDRWKEFPLFLPPLEEQLRIARYLDGERARVDQTTSRIEAQVSLLREHRQALITAAVTGKLDVAKAAA